MDSIMLENRGFSLVELLVVMFVAAIVVGGATTTFLIQNRASAVQQGTSDTQLVGQVTMEYLERDIRMAGFHVDKINSLVAQDNAATADPVRVAGTDALFVNYSTGSRVRYLYYIEDTAKVPAREGGLTRLDQQTGNVETIASNVEDMQVNIVPDPVTNVPTVTVRLLIRSPFNDPNYSNPPPNIGGFMPPVDHFRRRIYQTSIRPRNFGM